MSSEFKEKYPSTYVVINATEFKIEKPANPDLQVATWLKYKMTNMLKLLVAIPPDGVISFMSPLPDF